LEEEKAFLPSGGPVFYAAKLKRFRGVGEKEKDNWIRRFGKRRRKASGEDGRRKSIKRGGW